LKKRTKELFSWGWRRGALRVMGLFLLAMGSAAAAPPLQVTSATLGADARSIKIVFQNGRVATVHTVPGQDKFEEPAISDDRRTVAWSIENYVDASYPIPADLNAYRDGKPIPAFDCGAGVIQSFSFAAGGKQIVLYCGFAHGMTYEHLCLIDVATGKTLGQVDIDNNTKMIPPGAPAWARPGADKNTAQRRYKAFSRPARDGRRRLDSGAVDEAGMALEASRITYVWACLYTGSVRMIFQTTERA
jgi:hypothetical protein